MNNNFGPGGKIMAQAPNGQQIQVIIPPGKGPGEELTIEYDDPGGPPPGYAQPPPAYPGADYASDGVQQQTQQAVPHVEPIMQKQIHAVGVQPHTGAGMPVAHMQPQYAVGPNGQMLQVTPGQPTLVYDGHGGYISGYNIQMEKRFGIKSSLFCCVLIIIFWPAALLVPCCPCDETIRGTTQDGRQFQVQR